MTIDRRSYRARVVEGAARIAEERKLAKEVAVKSDTEWTLVLNVTSEPGTRVPPHVTMSKREFTTILERVGHAAAREDNRPILTCLNWVANGETLTVAAADGFVLATYTMPLVSEPFTWLLELEPLRKLKFGKAKQIEIIQVAADKLTINGIDVYMFPGKFPDLAHLLPASFAQSFEIETVDFGVRVEDALYAIKAATPEKQPGKRREQLDPFIALSWSVDTLTITPVLYDANGKERTDVESFVMPFAPDGVYGHIRLNGAMLHAALLHAPETVTFAFNSSVQPFALTAPGWMHLQMPVNKQR